MPYDANITDFAIKRHGNPASPLLPPIRLSGGVPDYSGLTQADAAAAA